MFTKLFVNWIISLLAGPTITEDFSVHTVRTWTHTVQRVFSVQLHPFHFYVVSFLYVRKIRNQPEPGRTVAPVLRVRRSLTSKQATLWVFTAL